VSHYLQDVDFTRNSFYIRLVLDLVFFQNFDGHFLSCDQMSSKPNFAESTLSERFADYIMADGPIGVRIWVLWRRLGSLGCR